MNVNQLGVGERRKGCPNHGIKFTHWNGRCGPVRGVIQNASFPLILVYIQDDTILTIDLDVLGLRAHVILSVICPFVACLQPLNRSSRFFLIFEQP